MNYQEVKLKGGAVVMIDLSARMSVCKKCGASIRFAITKKSGKYIPVSQTEDGNYQAHFADCKYADEFRGKGQHNLDIEAEQRRNQDFINQLK